jgi:radical SAM superfamily enzyme YgiQ (UPF0313 family)
VAGPDVLFVNLPPHESYYADGVPHLGMLYVLTSLREHGYSAGYLDCAQRGTRRDDVLRLIRDANPRMVGFSVDTDNLYNIAGFTRFVRDSLGPAVPIVLGGPASQAQAEQMISLSVADVVVIGEGEYTACEVADALLRGKGRLEDVPGLCYRGADGQPRRTRDRDPIEDLDALPFPDRGFLPDDRRYEVCLISGRGCPFRCTFCFEGRMGNVYRHRSAANLVAEIEHLVERYKRPFVMINDDTFTADVEHTREFCRLMRERFTPWKDLLFFCEVRADILNRHPDLIDELVAAGVARIQVGVESASRSMLKDYKRLNVKPEVVEGMVRRFHQAGIASIYCGFIAGGPRETRETMHETMDFARHLMTEVAPGSFECNMSFLTPLPGTDLYEHPDAYGLRLLDTDLKKSTNFNLCIAETETLSADDVTNLRLEFLERIDRDMDEVLKRLPRSVIQRHMTLKKDFGVGTRYADKIARIQAWSEYWEIVGGTGGLEPAEVLSDDAILDRFPTRLGMQARMEDGCARIPQGPRTLSLNRTGTEVYKRASGKVSTREIVDDLERCLNGTAPPRPELQADVIAVIRSLDEQCGLFLKDY